MERKIAIVYARVSSAGQADEELPVQSQVDVCTRRAEDMGADVIRVFKDEGISGRTDEREAFQSAIEFCKARQVDLFICWKTDRFSRNREDAPWYKGQLRKCGTRIVYVSQDIDVTKKDGRLMEGFYELLDDHRSQQIAEDTLRSMIFNAQRGNFNGGTVPYGFTSAADGKRRRLQVKEDEAAIVRSMFAKFLTGSGTKTIAKDLNRSGLLRRGKLWDKKHVIYILKNWVYAGYVTFHRQDHATGKMRPESEWIRTKGHEAIVTEETMNQAQAIFVARTPGRVGGTPRSRFLFSGLLRCGVCDEGLQIESASGRNRAYSYYNCRGAQKGTGCPHRRLPANLLDQWLLDFVLDKIISHQNIVGVIEQLDDMKLKWIQERGASRAALVSEKRDAESRVQKIYEVLELHGRDAPDLSTLGPRIRDLKRRIEAIDGEIDVLENNPAGRVQTSVKDAEVVARSLREVIVNSQQPERVREFLAGIIARVTITDAHAIVHYRPDRLISSEGGRFIVGADGTPNSQSLRTAVISADLPERFRKAA